MALIDLADPCREFKPNLQPQASISIPYNQITGFDGKTESVGIMWTDCIGSGNYNTLKL